MIPSGIATCFLRPQAYTLSRRGGEEGVTVYLDELFALNTALNYLLLTGSARLGGGTIRRLRVLLAAAIGGVYAALALFPRLSFLRAGGMQAAAAALMLLAAFGPSRRTLRVGALFLALAFSLGGAVFLCTQLFGGEVLLLPSGAYYPVSAAGILTLAGCGYLVAYFVFSRSWEHGGGEIVPLTLGLNGRTVQLRALHDTGNTLRDPITNERVLVVPWQTAAELLPQIRLDEVRMTRPDLLMQELRVLYPALHFRMIPYRAVGTASGLMLAVRCAVTDRKGRRKTVLTAFSPTPVTDGGDFNALIGGRI